MRDAHGKRALRRIARPRQISHFSHCPSQERRHAMFVRVVWQESRHFEIPELLRESNNGPTNRGINIFPTPGADMRRMTLGLFDR